MSSPDADATPTHPDAGPLVPRAAEMAAIRALTIDLATAEAVEALGREGIRSILLKGPAMARWLYDDEGQRNYVDCDLLVGPHDLEPTERVLTSLGFAREGIESIAEDWPKHALVLRRRRDRVAMDVHRTFVGVEVPDDVAWRLLSARTETMSVAGVRCEVLTPPGRALTLALHAAKDGGRVGKVRDDLARGVAKPLEVWQEAAELATRLEALPTFGWGLRRIPEGAELADRLGLPMEMSVGVALRHESAPPPLATGIDWMLRSPGVRGKLTVALRKLFPPRSFMRAWSPLARRGSIGLGLAYVWRPVWVIGRSVPALIAVIRARRKVRANAGR